jgi:hypothetical protein
MKHVGAFGNRPCVVIFREVPNEPENCLIVETGSLDTQIHDDLMMHIQSAEAQESNDISQVLARKQFSDGTNALNGLHFQKLIKKVPVSQVALTPIPGQSIQLADVNAEIRKIESRSENHNTSPERLATAETATNVPVPDSLDTLNEVADADIPKVAQGLLTQGQLMMDDAKALMADAEAKVAEAYALDPSLAPKKGPGRPKKSAD